MVPLCPLLLRVLGLTMVSLLREFQPQVLAACKKFLVASISYISSLSSSLIISSIKKQILINKY